MEKREATSDASQALDAKQLRIIHIAFLDGFLLRSARVSLLSQFELVQVKSGAWSVRCRRLGETFHPVVGPLVEAESLYIHQLQLPRKIRASSEIFVVWDVGLGSAGNVIALLRNTQNLEQGLRIISFDHSREPLRFAMQNLQRLDFLQCYEKALATLLENGSVKFKNGIQPVVWELIESDFPSLLESSNSNLWPKPSAIIYDAFSPARNPTMWTLPVFSRIRRLLPAHHSCVLATYSRSTLLRVTLLLAGFYVGAGERTGEKEETTLAGVRIDDVERPLGVEWLAKVRRSSSAEPLVSGIYRQAPLSAESMENLERHPQFAGGK